VSLRKILLLPLDDPLAVVREFFNPHVSRSGLDLCLRRHGAGNLRALKPKESKPTHGTNKAHEPGCLHIDVKYLPQMADEGRRRYLFVAIDRATRWVFVRIYPAQTAAGARRLLRDLERAVPMKITRVLTDNGEGASTPSTKPPLTAKLWFRMIFAVYELDTTGSLANFDGPLKFIATSAKMDNEILRCTIKAIYAIFVTHKEHRELQMTRTSNSRALFITAVAASALSISAVQRSTLPWALARSG